MLIFSLSLSLSLSFAFPCHVDAGMQCTDLFFWIVFFRFFVSSIGSLLDRARVKGANLLPGGIVTHGILEKLTIGLYEGEGTDESIDISFGDPAGYKNEIGGELRRLDGWKATNRFAELLVGGGGGVEVAKDIQPKRYEKAVSFFSYYLCLRSRVKENFHYLFILEKVEKKKKEERKKLFTDYPLSLLVIHFSPVLFRSYLDLECSLVKYLRTFLLSSFSLTTLINFPF